MKHLLANRVFVLVMISDMLQNVGIWIRNMAVLFFVVTQTNGNPIMVCRHGGTLAGGFCRHGRFSDGIPVFPTVVDENNIETTCLALSRLLNGNLAQLR